MRFFKSCRIVKRTRAREMLFLSGLSSVACSTRAPGTPGGGCKTVPPGSLAPKE